MSSTPRERAARFALRMAWAAALAGGAGAIGCAHQDPPKPIRTIGDMLPTAEPVVFDDEAMDRRQWSQSVSLYPSGTTQAFPLRWNYTGMETDYDITNAILDPAMFIVETFTYPFRLAMEPPSQVSNYAGPVVPPTYNAMAPLPPEPGAPPQQTPGMKFREWVKFNQHKQHPQAPEQVPALREPATTESTTTEPSTEPTTTPASTEPVTQPVTAPVGQ